ncbi:four-carbon acid sugar kinase family protein [Companilactobacillus baiquanensis]|uniref:Four-carbon acid sugar kinase family protein n=1 Tax=Companilactobacillus baiquanensis TaxID=2486005 RepID=A0ABW1UYL1_9LACO|nr:four-carbon acid sugar kinase family protein [Companilactobacillus baiquanensis]
MDKKYLIMADDFTGSTDTGVQLAKRGIPVQVRLHDENGDYSSLVVDTESRNLSPKDARDKITRAVLQTNMKQFDYTIKKVDSTLRGNISDELNELNKLYESDVLIFAPSLPSIGRQVKDSVLTINGVKGLNTQFAKDPVKPLIDDNIFNILKNAFPGEKIGTFSLNEIRNTDLKFKVDTKFYAADSMNDLDLQLLVKKVLKSKLKVLWVGSSGIMDAILSIENPVVPALAIVGSVSEVTSRQVQFAKENNVKVISIPIYNVYKNESYSNYVEKAIDAMKSGQDVIVTSSATINRDELKYTQDKLKSDGLSIDEIGLIVQSILGGLGRRIIKRIKPSGLFITGGDTAKGFFDVIKANSVDIITEVATGTPMMRIKGGEYDDLRVITKAGAFGNDDLISFSFKKLKEVSK